MARSKKACIVFFDEVDAIGGARFDDGVGGDNEVQRTMLEIVNQLDGFDARGNIKVLMATNRLVDSLSHNCYPVAVLHSRPFSFLGCNRCLYILFGLGNLCNNRCSSPEKTS